MCYPTDLVIWGKDERSLELAYRLKVPVVEQRPSQGWWLFFNADEVLGLSGEQEPRHVLSVDFHAPGIAARVRAHRRDHLLRLITKLEKPVTLLDATAGLGRDAALFAHCVNRLLLCESQPVVAALLSDGLKRASLSHVELFEQPFETLSLPEKVDVVYLDPLFGDSRNSKSLNGIDWRWLAQWGKATDKASEVQLFQAASEGASRRIIIKRPRHAPIFADHPPTRQVMAKSVRFDVYDLFND